MACLAGAAGGVGGLRIQLCRDPDLVPPLFAKPQQSAIWRRICPSPSRVLGVGIDAPAPESESLLARRHKSFAKPQKNYYAGGQLPPMNILNPSAWRSFINSWKRGDYKSKNK